MSTITRPSHLYPGQTILGPRDFHIRVERVFVGRNKTLIEGVNGWGEGFHRWYSNTARIEVLSKEVA